MAISTSTMKSFMNVLKLYANDTTTSGIAILDHAVRETTRFSNLQEAIDSFVNDVTDTTLIPDADQRLKETCGIVLGPDKDLTVDTGAVSGANAGNGTVKNAVTIVPETGAGSLSEVSMPVAGSVTEHSYTTADGHTFTFKIQWPASFTTVVDRKWQTFNDYNPTAWEYIDLTSTNQIFSSTKNPDKDTKYYTVQQLKESIEAISKGMYKWWAAESAKLIYDSYGVDFDGKTLKVHFLVNQEGIQADTGASDKQNNDTTPANEIEMTIGLPLYGNIDKNDVNGNTSFEGGTDQCYLDRTIAHEMVHAVMQASGTYKRYDEGKGVSMPEFFSEGIAELIIGLDDYDADNREKIRKLATNRKELENAMVLDDGTGTAIRYASGYMFLRYLCQQELNGYYGEWGKRLKPYDNDQASLTVDAKGESLTYKAKDTSMAQEFIISDTKGMTWNIDTSRAKGRTYVDAGVTRDEDGIITEANPVNNAVNVTTGSGRSEVVVCSNADSSIKGGSGSLIATVGGKGNHHVAAGSGSRNELYDFGSGGNVITGGSGKNTFESSNEKGTLVAGSGENIFKTTKGVTNKVEGFTYGRDQISLGTAVTDYTKFNVGEGTINYDGKAANGEVDVSNGTGTGNAYMVTMVDSTGHKTRVGWTGEDGGTVDASSETKPFVLIGDQNKDAEDLLIGGAGNDVIFAGENDSVRGGAGRNEIHLLGGSCRTVEFGTAGAKDEVAGFMAGFDVNDADSIYLTNSSVVDSLDIKFDGKDAVLKSGSTKMTFNSINTNGETNAVEMLISGVKVAAIEKGATATISEADYADVYFATGSAGLDFGAVSDDLTIDLSDKNRFRNIKTVTGGKDTTILMGGSGKTTLVSGGGDTSLWGGTGNALLVGAKDARDEFFFFGESGRDTISGFEAGTEDTSDVLNIFGSAVTKIKGTDKGVEIYTSDRSKLRIEGITANDKLQWESVGTRGVAKIGSSSKANTFTYDDEVTNYFGGSKKDTLKVSGDSQSVWMENLGSSIDIIDASNATGDNILAGGREAETIVGGRGDNSLWGGAGGNDVLQGGSGYNEFYFGKGEGKDTITQSGDSDKVMLYNVKLEDVNGQATGLKNGNMVIALNDGSTLTLKNYGNHGATTFQLADGTFSYDRNTDTWQEKK